MREIQEVKGMLRGDQEETKSKERAFQSCWTPSSCPSAPVPTHDPIPAILTINSYHFFHDQDLRKKHCCLFSQTLLDSSQTVLESTVVTLGLKLPGHIWD